MAENHLPKVIPGMTSAYDIIHNLYFIFVNIQTHYLNYMKL